MKGLSRILWLATMLFVAMGVFGQNVPFPYNKGQVVNDQALLPAGKSMADLNTDIKNFYDMWKNGGTTPWGAAAPGYLHEDSETGFWYLAAPPTDPIGDTPTEWKDMTPALHPVSHSEAHGYAMMIVALMAGYDADAQKIFDGLTKSYQYHQSEVIEYVETGEVDENGDPILEKVVHPASGMSWLLPNDLDNTTISKGTSAADGDMDIAYALLLADQQWGSHGAVNYLDIAKDMLGTEKGILKFVISDETNRILSGNWMYDQTDGKWDGTTDSTRYNHTQSRPSDWMLDHLRAFNNVVPNPKWDLAVNEIYTILPQIQSATGLFPDFIETRPDNGVLKPQPVHIHNITDWEGNTKLKYMESETDDDFSHNACRVPLRLAMDYLIYKNDTSKAALEKFNAWSTTLSANSDTWVESTWHGYTLTGDKLDPDNTSYGKDAAYYAPMMAAMIAGVPSGNTTNIEQYLADAWDDLYAGWLGDHTEWVYDKSANEWSYADGKNWSGYYGDTIGLLAMLVVSQNYWNPDTVVEPEGNVVNITTGRTYASLQSAVDAAGDGDVLEVYKAYADGQRPSGVNIENKTNLTIIGKDVDGKAPGLMASRYGAALGIWGTSSNITVENLRLSQGIGRLSIGWDVDGVLIKDFYVGGGMGEAAIIGGDNVTIQDSIFVGSLGHTSANIFLWKANNVKLHRNVLYRAPGPGVRLTECSNVDIYNNTIVDTWFGIAFDNSNKPLTSDNIKIKNNIIYDYYGGVVVGNADYPELTGVTIDHNLAYTENLADSSWPTLARYRNYDASSNLIELDPLLTTGAVLQENSAAINAGIVIPGVTDHVVDGMPDLGAKEAAFAPAPPIAAWSSSETYTSGDKAAVDGRPYTAKWWNVNETPEQEAFTAWEANYEEFIPDDYDPSAVYQRGDEVSHNFKFYRAKWWTQNEEPGASEWGPWEEFTVAPFVHE